MELDKDYNWKVVHPFKLDIYFAGSKGRFATKVKCLRDHSWVWIVSSDEHKDSYHYVFGIASSAEKGIRAAEEECNKQITYELIKSEQ